MMIWINSNYILNIRMIYEKKKSKQNYKCEWRGGFLSVGIFRSGDFVGNPKSLSWKFFLLQKAENTKCNVCVKCHRYIEIAIVLWINGEFFVGVPKTLRLPSTCLYVLRYRWPGIIQIDEQYGSHVWYVQRGDTSTVLFVYIFYYLFAIHRI